MQPLECGDAKKMGLTQSNTVNKTFLSIGFGKIRQKSVNGAKCDEHTKGAVYRKSEKAANGSWAIEYDALVGKIVNIYYKESKEFGNSYDVTFDDMGDLYQISFKEDQMGFSFLKKIPNINFDSFCELKTYGDFVSKEGKKVMAGLSVTQFGQKVQSAYEVNEGDKWKYLLGYPEPDEKMDWKDKDDRDAYAIRIKKFFKNEFATKWQGMFKTTEIVEAEVKENEAVDIEDAPLPF